MSLVCSITDEEDVSKFFPFVKDAPDLFPKCDGVHIDVVCPPLPGLLCDTVVYFPSFSFLWVGEYGCFHTGDESFVVDYLPAHANHVHLVFHRVGNKWHPEVCKYGVGCTEVVVDIHAGILDLLTDTTCCIEGVFIIDVVVEPEFFVCVMFESYFIVWEDMFYNVAHFEVTEYLIYIGVVHP